jgi:hypothetical protein
MKAVGSSETSVYLYRTIPRNIPDISITHCNNLRLKMSTLMLTVLIL